MSIFLLAGALAASVSACGGGGGGATGASAGGAASGDGTITMGFSQVGAESGWRTANTKSVQESAKA
ncbi:LacI family transcriptional regulator, partial [Sphaerisporangium sp. B11E5]